MLFRSQLLVAVLVVAMTMAAVLLTVRCSKPVPIVYVPDASHVEGFPGTAAPGQTVNILVDGVVVGTATADASGNYSVTTTPLADGAHVINAIGSGPATQPSAPVNMTVDTRPPSTPAITSLGTDTGVQGDGKTADDTIAISGKGEPGSTITIYDNGTPIGTAVVDPSGNWTFTTPPLADGAHSFTTTGTDASGNTSPMSAPADRKSTRLNSSH